MKANRPKMNLMHFIAQVSNMYKITVYTDIYLDRHQVEAACKLKQHVTAS